MQYHSGETHRRMKWSNRDELKRVSARRTRQRMSLLKAPLESVPAAMTAAVTGGVGGGGGHRGLAARAAAAFE